LDLSRVNWDDIFHELCPGKKKNVGSPCPSCGGTDRFAYSNVHGNGTWICRGCTPDGGQGLALVKTVLQMTDAGALTWLEERHGLRKPMQTTQYKYEKVEQEITKKEDVSIDVKTANGSYHHSVYKHLYEWRLQNGDLFGYVGRKANKVHHQIFMKDGEWFQGSVGDNRPLFGLDTMDRKGFVIVVEGEKTQQAVAKMCPNNPVITWTGGANAVAKSDWNTIRMKAIFIVPDNDEPGRKAAKKIKRLLPNARLVEIPDGLPLAWDLADVEWDETETLNWIRDNAETLMDFSGGSDDEEIRKELKVLGFNDKKIYLMPRSTLQVQELSNSILGKDVLITLADSTFWMTHFPKEDFKINWEKGREWILRESKRVGAYYPEQNRGCGAWVDKGRIVVHMGNELIVDGKPTNLVEFQSDFIYPLRRRMGKWSEEEMSATDRALIFDIFDSVNWYDRDFKGRSLSTYMALGYLVSSITCGVYDWRTHLWIIGAAGVGKSTIVRDVLKKLQGRWSLYVEGETTEAGLRQALKCDALPVIFDEAESDSYKDSVRNAGIIKFGRSCSSNSESVMLKGSAGGDASSYHTCSQLCLSSINASIQYKSDRDRWFKAEISSRPMEGDHWEILQGKIAKLDQALSDRLFHWAVTHIPVMKANIKRVAKHVASKLGSERYGDKYASMLGPALTFKEGRELTQEEINTMIDDFFWEYTEEKVGAETEEKLGLSLLLESVVPVTPEAGGRKDYVIAEMIYNVAENDVFSDEFRVDGDNYSTVKKKDLVNTLAQYGLYVDKKGGMVRIANINKNLPKLFNDNPKLKTGWNEVFKRLKGAEKSSKQQYLGIKGRTGNCLFVPLEHFVDPDVKEE